MEREVHGGFSVKHHIISAHLHWSSYTQVGTRNPPPNVIKIFFAVCSYKKFCSLINKHSTSLFKTNHAWTSCLLFWVFGHFSSLYSAFWSVCCVNIWAHKTAADLCLNAYAVGLRVVLYRCPVTPIPCPSTLPSRQGTSQYPLYPCYLISSRGFHNCWVCGATAWSVCS